MHQPLVSVIMLSWNHEAYVSHAIKSVLAQSEGDLELIIVDDASSDGSREIIRSWGRQDCRIRVILHVENMGIAEAMNDGLQAARGEHIALFSSDDLWKPNKLERQLNVLRARPGVVVWGEASVIDKHGIPTGELFTGSFGPFGQRRKSGDIFDDLCRGNYICGESIMSHRTHFEGIAFDPELRYLNDYKVNLTLACQFPFYFIAEPLVMYRIHGQNSILRDRPGWANDQALFYTSLMKDRQIRRRLTRTAKHGFLAMSTLGHAALGNRGLAWLMLGEALRTKPIEIKNLILLAATLACHWRPMYLVLERAHRILYRILGLLPPWKRE